MKLTCMMAGALIALSAGGPQYVLAETKPVQSETQVRIENASDFIKVFLTETTAGKDGTQTSAVTAKATEQNYERILAAQAFLDTAKDPLKKSIETELEKQKIDLKALVTDAQALSDKLKPAASQEPAREQAAAQTPPAATTPDAAQPAADAASPEPAQPQTPAASGQGAAAAGQTGQQTQESQAQPEQETGKTDVQAEQDKNAAQPEKTDTPPAQDKTEAQPEKTDPQPAQDTNDTQTDTSGPAEQQPAGSDSTDPAGKTPEVGDSGQTDADKPETSGTGQETGSQPEQGAPETAPSGTADPAEEKSADPQPAIGGMTMNIPSASTPAAQSWNGTTQSLSPAPGASAFLASWLTSSQGNLYGAATSQNQARILQAVRSWNALSAADRQAVNSQLKQSTGKTFQKLVQEAQQLSLGGHLPAVRSRVNTAARDETGFFTGLLTGSLALFALLAQRLKRTRQEAEG